MNDTIENQKDPVTNQQISTGEQTVNTVVPKVASKSIPSRFKILPKWILGLIALLIITVAGIVWWQFSVKATPQAKDLGEVTFGWNLWPGTLPFLVAHDKGYFTEQGLKVTMREEASYGDMLNNTISGKDNVSTLALMDIMLANNDGANLQVVGVQDYSNGADGIVAKKSITSLGGLKGKKIAVELGTLGEYLLSAALEKAGLSASDVTLVNLTAQEAAKAFINGKVDTAVTYEPDYTDAVEKGNGFRIFTSADEPGIIVDVVAAKKEYIDAHPEQITAFLKAQFKAVQFITDNPKEAYAIGAKYFKITPDEFETQMKGVRLENLRDNASAFSYAAGYESLYGNSRYVNTFLRKNKKITTDIDSSQIIMPDFVRQINRE